MYAVLAAQRFGLFDCLQGSAVSENNVQSLNVDAEIACMSVDNGRVPKILAEYEVGRK